MPEPAALRAEWDDLLTRRPDFRPTLAFYEPVIAAWGRFDASSIAPLGWSPDECRERWDRDVAILAEAPLPFDRESLEPLVWSALEAMAGLGEGAAEAMAKLAWAWEDRQLHPRMLLTEVGDKERDRWLAEAGVSPDLLGLVAQLVLRPPVEAYLSGVRLAFKDEYWDRGHCALCGATPGWADIRADGKRWLCCGLCGGEWTIGRIRCPFCDNRNAGTLTRLAPEGADAGYLIEACDLCHGYLKGVDRRVRWTAGSPLVEDWGTPHLDLVAVRRRYWRTSPTLVQLVVARQH